jgi:hypothetical protein
MSIFKRLSEVRSDENLRQNHLGLTMAEAKQLESMEMLGETKKIN